MIAGFWSRMNPTVRGFLVIALIAATVMVLNLYVALASLFVIARIAFALAIAFFVYLLWRERRQEIATWPGHAKVAFYGGALLIVVALGVYFARGAVGLDALALVLVIGLSGFAMWRAWRDQHTYGY
jgi:ABC-type nickel/cobalt efflux system permease component RcnA